jgi:hypothetical protein
MGSLNKGIGTRQKEKSKILRITLPRSNPNIKSDIDTELDDGWHIAGGPVHFNDGSDRLLIVFTKPKKNP